MSDPPIRDILRTIESHDYTVNRMTLLLRSGRRYCFTEWSADENPGGVWRGNGERYRAEADEPFAAVCQLVEMLGISIVDG